MQNLFDSTQLGDEQPELVHHRSLKGLTGIMYYVHPAATY